MTSPQPAGCQRYVWRLVFRSLKSQNNIMSSPKLESNTLLSEELFARAAELIPGGVNSPVRAFRGVGGVPRFIKRAKGAMMTDADDNEFIDYISSWGALMFGHADDEILSALHEAMQRGTSYGAPTELEVEMAEEIIDAVPSVEMVRMVNSGTEATMAAIRLARGYTGREKIIKFEGCYHGHGDSFLVKAGSGVATLGLPDSPGVPESVAKSTLTVPYNDPDALEETLFANKDTVAAVILEPVVGNMGCVIPKEGYLQKVIDLAHAHNALVIFDEVMTGFRLSRGGAQEIIGGGLPVGAYGASKEIMRHIAPAGTIYQAGTLSGNPLAMTAGLATLRRLHDTSIYDVLDKRSEKLVNGLRQAAEENGFRVTTNRVGTMFTLFFTNEPVTDWTGANRANRELFGKFFHALLNEGVYLPPSQFEAGFFGMTHTEEIIERTVEAAQKVFQLLTISD
jgi:glutamate-1-semialdehyde 2,1-aminomutase